MQSKYYEIRHKHSGNVYVRFKALEDGSAMILDSIDCRVEISRNMANWYLKEENTKDFSIHEISREQFSLTYSQIIQEQIKNL